MSEIDDQLGRVFDYLSNRAMGDTLIVFTCDHGEQAGTITCWARSAISTTSIASR